MMDDFDEFCRATAFICVGAVLCVVLSPIIVPVLIIRGVYLLYKDCK